jgi:hypothetical protein
MQPSRDACIDFSLELGMQAELGGAAPAGKILIFNRQ